MTETRTLWAVYPDTQACFQRWTKCLRSLCNSCRGIPNSSETIRAICLQRTSHRVWTSIDHSPFNSPQLPNQRPVQICRPKALVTLDLPAQVCGLILSMSVSLYC